MLQPIKEEEKLWNNSNITVNCFPTSTNDIITNHNVTICPNPTIDLFINSQSYFYHSV